MRCWGMNQELSGIFLTIEADTATKWQFQASETENWNGMLLKYLQNVVFEVQNLLETFVFLQKIGFFKIFKKY